MRQAVGKIGGRIGLTVGLLVGVLSAAFGQGRAVGQLVSLKGDVTVQLGDKKDKGFLMFPLQDEAVLTLRKGASADVVLYASRARYRLSSDPSGETRVKVSGQDPQPKLVPLAGKAPQVLSQVAMLPGFSGLLEGQGGVLTRGASSNNPAPDGAVRAQPVTLRWDAPKDSQKLLVVVKTEPTPGSVESGDDVVRAPVAPGTAQFAVPAGKLKRGTWYKWNVFHGEQPWCGGRLQVMDADTLTTLRALEKAASQERSQPSAGVASRLILAQSYASLGLRAEALKLCEEIRRAHPNDPGIARVLASARRASSR
jgi:hypothetical protein